MQIRPEQLISKVMDNSFQISSTKQELSMFQLSIINAMRDTNQELYQKYMWYSTFFQASHLEIARSVLRSQSPPDLDSLNQIAKHIKIIQDQAEDEGLSDAFIQGSLHGHENKDGMMEKADGMMEKTNGQGNKIITG